MSFFTNSDRMSCTKPRPSSKVMETPLPARQSTKAPVRWTVHVVFALLTIVCLSAYFVSPLPRSRHQFPLSSSKPLPTETRPSLKDYAAVAPFVFDSLQGLLKQWPNSYGPNGHSIVAGKIPPATVLYHAKQSPGLPKKPTFFAFDAEMSIGIYGGMGHANLHTYVTTRPLKVIYFDGQSATLSTLGSLDSQMAILQGHVPLNPSYDLVYDEHQRALELCQLAAELDIDAIVRMNAGFETLICDISASEVEEVFVTNITIPGNTANEGNKSLPHDPNRQPPLGIGNVFSQQGSYEWLRSATWHYGGHGDGGPALSRVQLDVCQMLSFYDPELSSLSGSHHGGLVGNETNENGFGLRRGHRLLEINSSDVKKVRSWLHGMKQAPNESKCSGVDWRAMIEAIQTQHGTRAREISATFKWENSTLNQVNTIFTRIHEISHAVLVPYLEYPTATRAISPKDQTISRCKSIYTKFIDSNRLSRSEVLFYESTKAVLEKLCNWEWELFEWSEKRTTNFLGHQDKTPRLRILHAEILEYHTKTTEVLKWMGWDMWYRCDRQCAEDELCTIPTWPVVYAPGLPQGAIYASTSPKLTEDQTKEFWRPKCVSRTDFDRGGGRGREPNYQFPDVPPV